MALCWLVRIIGWMIDGGLMANDGVDCWSLKQVTHSCRQRLHAGHGDCWFNDGDNILMTVNIRRVLGIVVKHMMVHGDRE